MIALKIFVAVALFALLLVAPGLMGILLIAFVLYAVADVIVDDIFKKHD
jgi:hypothetical protein